MGENIEKLFYQEVREKKRIGYGAYHNSGRRGGGNKGVRTKTTVDYLSGKEKKEYMKGGIIKVSNVYDDIKNIPSLEELKEMDFEKAKHIVGVCKNLHTNKLLMEHWEIKTSSSLYGKVYYKYKIVERKSKEDRLAIRRGEKPEEVQQQSLDKEVIKSYKAKVKELESELNDRNDKLTNYQNRNEINEKTLLEYEGKIESLVEEKEYYENIGNDFDKLKESYDNLKNQYDNKLNFGMELKFKGDYKGSQIMERVMKYLETIIDNSDYIIDFNLREQIPQKIEEVISNG